MRAPDGVPRPWHVHWVFSPLGMQFNAVHSGLYNEGSAALTGVSSRFSFEGRREQFQRWAQEVGPVVSVLMLACAEWSRVSRIVGHTSQGERALSSVLRPMNHRALKGELPETRKSHGMPVQRVHRESTWRACRPHGRQSLSSKSG
jgi:hypothetical protein